MLIVVLGATGNVGSEVVTGAVAAGHSVRAVSRSGGTSSADVEHVAGDLNDAATIAPALDGADALFTLAGYAGLPATLAAARAAGVGRVALLSSSAAPSGSRTNAVARYNLESEDLVAASGLAATIVRPNAFASNALRWLPQLADGDIVREPFGDVALSVIDPADIAAVVLHGLAADVNAGVYRVSGPEALTAAQRLAVLGDVLGRPLREEPMTDAEIREQLTATMPQEYVDAFFEFYRGGLIDETTVQPDVERALGRPPVPFRTWVEANAGQFRR
jgi:uncharacterized protein YbjT (DUF2867 family)